VLLNDASSFIFRSLDATVREWREVVGVNIIGTALCLRYAADEMKGSGGGAIVNIASISDQTAQPNLLTYNTTKAAIVEMAKCMALDLAPFNIRVNSVSPGRILTEHQLGKIKALNMAREKADIEWGVFTYLKGLENRRRSLKRSEGERPPHCTTGDASGSKGFVRSASEKR
jgi:dihydroanticapsin dehydrogenase